MRLPVDSRSLGGEPRPAEPLTLTGTADATGTCTLTSKPVPEGRRWYVDYLTVTATGANTPALNVYVDQAANANLIDGTAKGNRAVAPYIPPRVLSQGQTLVLQWTGATVGATCSVRIEYRVAGV